MHGRRLPATPPFGVRRQGVRTKWVWDQLSPEQRRQIEAVENDKPWLPLFFDAHQNDWSNEELMKRASEYNASIYHRGHEADLTSAAKAVYAAEERKETQNAETLFNKFMAMFDAIYQTQATPPPPPAAGQGPPPAAAPPAPAAAAPAPAAAPRPGYGPPPPGYGPPSNSMAAPPPAGYGQPQMSYGSPSDPDAYCYGLVNCSAKPADNTKYTARYSAMVLPVIHHLIGVGSPRAALIANFVLLVMGIMYIVVLNFMVRTMFSMSACVDGVMSLSRFTELTGATKTNITTEFIKTFSNDNAEGCNKLAQACVIKVPGFGDQSIGAYFTMRIFIFLSSLVPVIMLPFIKILQMKTQLDHMVEAESTHIQVDLVRELQLTRNTRWMMAAAVVILAAGAIIIIIDVSVADSLGKGTNEACNQIQNRWPTSSTGQASAATVAALLATYNVFGIIWGMLFLLENIYNVDSGTDKLIQEAIQLRKIGGTIPNGHHPHGHFGHMMMNKLRGHGQHNHYQQIPQGAPQNPWT